MTMTMARPANGVQAVDAMQKMMPNLHDLGIEAHVLIYLNPDVSVEDAIAAINKVCTSAPADFRMVHLHTALGEIDLLADVFCQWTTQPGRETSTIGDFVSALRKARTPAGTVVIARTTTAVCMNMH